MTRTTVGTECKKVVDSSQDHLPFLAFRRWGRALVELRRVKKGVSQHVLSFSGPSKNYVFRLDVLDIKY